MTRYYFLIAFRVLKRYKLYSAINIIGFSIALVPVILAILYVINEFSYDKHNRNYNRIFRVVNEFKYYDQSIKTPINPNPLAAAMKFDLPQISQVTRLASGSEKVFYEGKENLERNVFYADPEIFKIFTINLLKGNDETVLNDKYSMLLSESMAQKYFGNENPIGKTIVLKSYDMKVTGVFEDLPINAHFHPNFIVSALLLDGSSTSMGIQSNQNSWGISMFYTYFLLKDNTSIDELKNTFPSFLKRYSRNDAFNQSKIYFQPLEDIHLHSHLRKEFEKNGDINNIYLAISIVFMIVVIACINYVNLTTARSSQRIKEIGIRKVFGAYRGQLVMQLLAESFVITFCSFLFTLFIVRLILPFFNTFVERNIQFSILFDYGVFGWIILFIGLISIFSGIYPALFLSSAKPLSYFSFDKGSLKNPRFRGILIVAQYFISLVLIFCTLVVKEQLSYISSKDLGFDANNIIIVSLGNISNGTIETIKNELKKYHNILDVSSSAGLPSDPVGSGGIDYPGKPSNIRFKIAYTVVDYNFLKLYDFKILEGRSFSKQYPSDENDAIIINQTAARELGWKKPIGMLIRYTSPHGSQYRKIIGVVSDFNTSSLYEKIIPYYFVMDPEEKSLYLSIKIKPDNISQTIGFIEKEMKQFMPKNSFKFQFYEDIIKSSYSSVLKLQSTIFMFSIFSIFISILGLMGLISFITETRKKEIGIRKILGASVVKIILLILKEIMSLILVSCMIAIPVAYYFMGKWLSEFAYRININLLEFILASMLVTLISIIILSLQVNKVSQTNPIEALRYE